MTQLVAYYEDKPVPLKGQVEIHQEPISAAAGARSTEGAVHTGLVYVVVPSETGRFHVPFGEYDDWSLRDRYNEAIRIMNTLGASEITCETFREVTVRRRFLAKLRGHGADLTQERVTNSGFDFRHSGAGSAARDPRPLRWPNEPGFAAAVSSVLENGAKEVVINIRSERTFAVDGTLAVKLKKVGFEVGGHTHSSDATSLHIRAVFPGRKGWK